MKKLLIAIIALILSTYTYSQTMEERPKVGACTIARLTIEKVELQDSATVLYFRYRYGQGNISLISGKSYIQPADSKEKLFVRSAEGVKMDEEFKMPESGEIFYRLIFPKIDKSVAKIDFGDSSEHSDCFIYDVQVRPELVKTMIPLKFEGNWFRAETGEWKASLYDSVAVYKSQVWKCRKFSEKNGLAKIILRNGSEIVGLYLKPGENNTCQIGESAAKLFKYTKEQVIIANKTDDKPYKLPVFKTDTAIYCGYIKGFNPRITQKTGKVYVNDLLTGNSTPLLLVISDDGSFRLKIALKHPQEVNVYIPFYSDPVYLEPGKTTFQIIDKGNKISPAYFMGDNVRMNTDLLKEDDFYNFDNKQFIREIDGFTPNQYKAYCQKSEQRDLRTLELYDQSHPLSAKTLQLMKLAIKYQYASLLLEYDWYMTQAYRTKNNIPRNQPFMPIKTAKPDSAYYDFLTNNLLNNPLAVLTIGYNTFIRSLINVVSNRIQLQIPEISAALEKTGYHLSPDEMDLTTQLKSVDSPALRVLQLEFQEKYIQQSLYFDYNHRDKIRDLKNEKKGMFVTPEMEDEYFALQHVILTDDEKAFRQTKKEFYRNPLVYQYYEAESKYSRQIQQFHSKHKEFITELYKEERAKFLKEKLKKSFGIQQGFGTDVITCQEYCSPMVSEGTPLGDEKIKEIQKQITTPFIAALIRQKNNEAKAKIENNKKLTGYRANEVPKTAGDKVFDAIIAKYKGKVVYVDFWATWCGPCKSGIEEIKPLKEEMAGEKVVFVYITNQTSPKTTYDNMIPGIKGEHYRVSEDEWNFLTDRFKIIGIPHEVIVGKDGKVYNKNNWHPENSELKEILMKYIKE